MSKIRILEWNVNAHTKRNYKVPSFVSKDIIERNPDVFVLCEYMQDKEWEEGEISENYSLFSTPYEERRNGIVIGIKKDTYSLIEVDSDITETLTGFKPNYLMTGVEFEGQKIAVIGYRCLVGMADESAEYINRMLLLRELKPKLFKIQNNYDKVIVVGDFNNGKINGSMDKSFSEVKEKYDGKLNSIYNLHSIRDLFKESDLVLIEKDDKFSSSFVYKENIMMRLDHMFVSSSMYSKSNTVFDWSFINLEKGYNERWNEYKIQAWKDSLPDHAILIGNIEI